MHPLTEKIIKHQGFVAPGLDQLIRSYLKERAEWLEERTLHGNTIVREAFQLTPETCDKCGQEIKEPS